MNAAAPNVRGLSGARWRRRDTTDRLVATIPS